jgi:tetratricopeptide (TPR) repeat protein
MKFYKPIVICVTTIFMFVSSCKQTDDTVTNTSDPVTKAVKLTSDGWKAFEQKDYPKAAGLFQEALDNNNLYTDAYTGLGWTYGRQNLFDEAKRNFDIALGLDNTLVDAYAGRSFVSIALEKYQEAITAVSIVEQRGTVFYVFRHDGNISINDLKLVKAQSYFMLGDYSSALSIIDELDPENDLDPSLASYIEDLSLAIENLWNTI